MTIWILSFVICFPTIFIIFDGFLFSCLSYSQNETNKKGKQENFPILMKITTNIVSFDSYAISMVWEDFMISCFPVFPQGSWQKWKKKETEKISNWHENHDNLELDRFWFVSNYFYNFWSFPVFLVFSFATWNQ